MESRVALVTGGNRGIGFATVNALARRGYAVALTARTESAAIEQSNVFSRYGFNVRPYQLDVLDSASVIYAFRSAAQDFGRIDVLVNNAGLAIDNGRSALMPDFEIVLQTFETNLMGAWRCCVAGVAEMRKHNYGRIVNVSSELASLGAMSAGSPAYRLSKLALNGLTKIVADECRDLDLLVNSASPGKVDTRIANRQTGRSPDAAVDTIVKLATLPTGGPTGMLFGVGYTNEGM